MAKYLLLLHEAPDTFSDISPEQIQSIIAEYVAWREGLVARKIFIASEKLKDEGGKHLSGNGKDVRVVDGPFSEAKEVLGGFFMIEAADYDSAVNISRDCPHLKYGGRIELREVDDLH